MYTLTLTEIKKIRITEQTRSNAIGKRYKKPESILKNIDPGIANV